MIKRIVSGIEGAFKEGDVLYTVPVCYFRPDEKVKFEIQYTHKDNHIGADWSAYHKIADTQGSTGNVSIFFICKVDLSKDSIEGLFIFFLLFFFGNCLFLFCFF